MTIDIFKIIICTMWRWLILIRVCRHGYLCEVEQHHIGKLGFCDENVNKRSRTLARVKVACQYAARHVNKVFTGQDPKNPIYGRRLELDSHADTFVTGRNCSIMNFTEQICDVMSYSDDYRPKEGVPICQVATGYTSINGQRSILVFNEALWMPELEASLMNPNQLRHYGIEVQDNPYHPSDPIVIRKEDADEGDFVACLKSQGMDINLDT